MAKMITTTMRNVRELIRETMDIPDNDKYDDSPAMCADEASGMFPPGVFAWVHDRNVIKRGRNTATLIFKFSPRQLKMNINDGNDGIMATTQRLVANLVNDVLVGELGWKRSDLIAWRRDNILATIRFAHEHEHAAKWPDELCFVITFMDLRQPFLFSGEDLD